MMAGRCSKLRRSAIRLVAVGICLSAATASGDTIHVEALFPGGAAPGTTVDLELTGSLPRWPLKVWSSRSDVRVAVGKKKGRCRVSVAADASPGAAWLRFYDEKGVSPRRLLLIAPGPRTLEKEPNDRLSEAQRVELPRYVDGRLQRSGDVDAFRVELSAGQQLVARFAASHWFDVPVDAVLQLVDRRGNVVAQNDDAAGVDPLLVHRSKTGGTFFVRVFGFPRTPNSSIAFAGKPSFVYQLLLSTGPVLDHTLPLARSMTAPATLRPVTWNAAAPEQPIVLPAVKSESPSPWQWIAARKSLGLFPIMVSDRPYLTVEPSADGDRPVKATLPMTATCRFERPESRRAVSLTMKKGQAIRIVAESERFGLRLDPLLTVFGASGKQLREFDDSGGRPDLDATWRAPADGDYRFVLRDRFGHGGKRHTCLWRMWEVAPSFTLTLDRDVVEVPAGKSVKIEVDIARLGGFDRQIEIAPRGLPPGVTCAVTSSAAKGSTAKKVKLEFKADASAETGPFRIVGRAAGESNETRSESAAVAKDAPALADPRQLWLQVVGAKRE